MDIADILRSIRPIASDDIELYLPAKLTALRSTYQRLAPLGRFEDFGAFVRAVPASVLTTYFGSGGIDQHYTRLLAGLAVGQATFDAIAAMTLNYVLQQLTYQGRYLGRYPLAEALVAINADPERQAVALANVDRIEALAIGHGREIDEELARRMPLIASNYRCAAWGTAEALEGVLDLSGRPIGCLAWHDVAGEGPFGVDVYNDAASRYARYLTEDSFHIFTGTPEDLLDLRGQLVERHGGAAIQQKIYALHDRGAYRLRSILIATGLVTPPHLALPGRRTARFPYLSPDDFAAGKAVGMVREAVRPPETIPVRLPVDLSSSAPLSMEQIATVSNDVTCEHNVFRLEGGKVIHAENVHAECYVVTTSADQVVELLHYMPLISAVDEGKPDADGVATAIRKPSMYVAGNALLFSFSPAIVAYHSHFLLQCFTRVTTAEALGLPDMRLLVPSTLRKYQLRMLEMAGWGSDRLVVMDPGYTYVCDTLHVPNIPPAIFSPFQSTIYDRLIAQVEPVAVDPTKRIIISRAARTTWRNMVNYDAVCDLLVRDLGFEVVEPDKLSIEDEIRLFQSSAIVVGAEGAGMYNCCFMAPGTDVVVMADQDYVMYVVGSMAAIRDFDVSFVFGESFQADRDLTRKAGHADFVADPLRVKAAVERVIARRTAQAR